MTLEQLEQLLGIKGSGTGRLLPNQTAGQPNPRANLVGNVQNITPSYGIAPSSNMAPVQTQDMQSGSVMGQEPQQQGILGNINQFMMNPSTALAIGLLQPTKGGTFGEALGGGYQNLMAQNLMQQKLKQQQFANLLGIAQARAALGKTSNLTMMQDDKGNTIPVAMRNNQMIDVSTGLPVTDISKYKPIQNPAVSISQGGASPLATRGFDIVDELDDRALAMPRMSLRRLDDMEALLPNMFKGPLARQEMAFNEGLQALDQLGSFFGLKFKFADAESTDRVANTRTYINQLARAGLEARQQLKGQGAITDKETTTLEAANQADFAMTEQSILKLIEELRLVQFDSIYVNRQKLKKLQSIIPRINPKDRGYYEDEYKRLFALSQLPPDLENQYSAFVELYVEGRGR
mgnify:CR=1 FL=1